VLRQLARAFDAEERAEALISELEIAVEEARAALTAAASRSRWPPCTAGRVVVLDRLGYPGIEGRTRAARDLAGALRP
jgi:hypothetical protein